MWLQEMQKKNKLTKTFTQPIQTEKGYGLLKVLGIPILLRPLSLEDNNKPFCVADLWRFPPRRYGW
jgi:hypothetical protein